MIKKMGIQPRRNNKATTRLGPTNDNLTIPHIVNSQLIFRGEIINSIGMQTENNSCTINVM